MNTKDIQLHALIHIYIWHRGALIYIEAIAFHNKKILEKNILSLSTILKIGAPFIMAHLFSYYNKKMYLFF